MAQTEQLFDREKRLKNRFKRLIKWSAGLILLPALLLMLLFALFNQRYPLNLQNIEVSTTVVAKEGEVLRQFADREGVFRQWTSLDEVAPAYLNALIQYEDRYFYHHFGINPLSTIRAFGQFLRHQTVISGSSTLTMQVARLLYPHERTLSGKVAQMFRALQLELAFTKEEILTLYINLAPMGGNIEGVSSASQRYFSKNAGSLTLSESALLVAIPQRPSIYRPDKSLEKARYARDKVLNRLYDFGQIDAATYQQASQDPINYTPGTTPFYAPLLSARLKRQYPKEHLIQTTIDYTLQRQVEQFLLTESKRFAPRVSASVLIVNNQTHEVVTYVGSVDLFDRNRAGFLDMVTAVRSPGSTLKPFAYGLAMDYGIIHEASLLADVPRSFDGYEPQNFDRKFRGRVPVNRALQHSLNVPVVQVFQHLTPFYFLKAMRNAGIELQVGTPTLSLILGGVGTTLEEQVRLFSSFANDGKIYPLSMIQGEEIAENAGKPLLTPEANWIITKILRGVNPPKRLNTRNIAWKTGTSYGYRDAWAIGTSPDWTVGIWIGRPDGVPNVGVLAGDIAAPMLFDLFTLLPSDHSRFIKPEGIWQERICWPSGRKKSQVAANECFSEFQIDTIAGNVPATLYDAKGEQPHNGWPKLLTDEAIHPRKTLSDQTEFNHEHSNHERANYEETDQAGNSNIFGIKILTLPNESIIFKTDYSIKLEAQGRAPFRWYLDGRLLPAPKLDLRNISIGMHRLSVLDDLGNSDQVQIDVREID